MCSLLLEAIFMVMLLQCFVILSCVYVSNDHNFRFLLFFLLNKWLNPGLLKTLNFRVRKLSFSHKDPYITHKYKQNSVQNSVLGGCLNAVQALSSKIMESIFCLNTVKIILFSATIIIYFIFSILQLIQKICVVSKYMMSKRIGIFFIL